MTLATRPADFEALVELLSTADGGRRSPSLSGYRPHLSNGVGELTSGSQEYIGTDMVAPGGSAMALITLLTPEFFVGALEVGMRIPFSEGARIVGYATITKILNPHLAAGGTLPTTSTKS